MRLKEKEELLFTEWFGPDRNYAKDGIVNEAAYLNSKYKICFILKEINDEQALDWDLTKYIADGARAATWNNVARWAFGIANLEKTLPWCQLTDITKIKRINWLESICALNLKKKPGKANSISSELYQAVRLNKKWLEKQYNLYQPDITICCGTKNYFLEVIDCNQSDVKRTSRNIEWLKLENDSIVVFFYHPQARFPSSLMYYSLIDAIKEIKEVLNNTGSHQLHAQ